MKRFRPLFLIALFLIGNLVSQVTLTTSYVPPKFPKGPKEFDNYASKYIHYPLTLLQQGITGVVDVIMYINKEGKVKLVRTAGYNIEFNNEAKRVLKLSPNWLPGKRNEIAIDTMVNLKVYYCLEKEDPKATENDVCIVIVSYQEPLIKENFEKENQEEKKRQIKINNSKN